MPSEAQLRQIIDLVHCPSCGKPAKAMSIRHQHGLTAVAPVYCCDTEDCEFSIEGPFAWTPDFMD